MKRYTDEEVLKLSLLTKDIKKCIKAAVDMIDYSEDEYSDGEHELDLKLKEELHSKANDVAIRLRSDSDYLLNLVTAPIVLEWLSIYDKACGNTWNMDYFKELAKFTAGDYYFNKLLERIEEELGA